MSDIIRSLGFYQPFGSLMLHGKIETRWCREGRKPPFPLGNYLLYTTLKSCDEQTLVRWCGKQIMYNIFETLKNEPTKTKEGYAIAIATLKHVSSMIKEQEQECFVEYKGVRLKEDAKGNWHPYRQQCLWFLNIERIEPFQFKGKQGVGILTDEQKSQIKILDNPIN